jgi:hypothetical protein
MKLHMLAVAVLATLAATTASFARDEDALDREKGWAEGNAFPDLGCIGGSPAFVEGCEDGAQDNAFWARERERQREEDAKRQRDSQEFKQMLEGSSEPNNTYGYDRPNDDGEPRQ